MVAPKNISTNLKEKQPSDKKSKSPSPEPFQEPDGMTTIDLNKSDDYSKEFELEKAELKKRTQMRYTAQLLFALCSILVVVLLFIMMAFLNKEYHVFTVIPLKINQSEPHTKSIPTSLSNEKFLNLTKILNQEKFWAKLKYGKYIEQFALEMDLCKLIRSVEYCCNIFKRSDLYELSEYCTVEDMLNYLIEYDMDLRKKRQSKPHENSAANPKLPKIFPKVKKRQAGYNSHYESYPHSYNHLEPIEQEVHQQQYADPYNEFDQYQRLDYQDHYLQTPHVSNQGDIQLTGDNFKNVHPNVDDLALVNRKFQFPTNMISEIERSHNDFALENWKNNQEKLDRPVQYIYNPEDVQHGHMQLEGFNQRNPNINENLDLWQSMNQNAENNIDSVPRHQNLESTLNVFQSSSQNFNRNNQEEPKLQSFLKPLPEKVREEILHHVTIAPKVEHVYKSGDFPKVDHFNENLGKHNDFEGFEIEDLERRSHDDRRPEVQQEYKLKVRGNGKFHLDTNQHLFNYEQEADNIRSHDIIENNMFNTNLDQLSKDVPLSEPKLFLDLEKIQNPLQITPELLGSPLDLKKSNPTSQIKLPPNLMVKNKKPNSYLEPVALPDLNITHSENKDSMVRNSQTEHIPFIKETNIASGMADTDLRSSSYANLDNADKFEKHINYQKNSAVLSTIHTSNNNDKQKAKNKDFFSTTVNNINDDSSLTIKPIKFVPSTVFPVSVEQTKNNQTEFLTTSTNMQDFARLAKNSFTIYENLDYKTEIINNVETTTVYGGSIETKIKIENVLSSEDETKNVSKNRELIQNDFSRANTAQDVFRGKQKQDSFTGTEDLQSNQQTIINPCFNPYMSPYIPFMPPSKVGSTQESGYLKVVPVSQPHVQNQAMYVLNPSMFYGIPPSAQSTPGLTQNPFFPQAYFPQLAQSSPYGGSYNVPVQVTSPGGQYYMCNPIPTPANNIAGLAGVEVRRDASNLQTLVEDIEDFGRNNKSREATLICPLGEQACLDNIKCIKNNHICDSEVHCDDSSDEMGCDCKDRVGKLRSCDGYCDCPRCEDEQECFGCETDEYSCDDWSRFRRSTCIPISQRCDGIKQCEITGKDELDCSMLADHIGNFPLNKVSNAVGFLHRNYKGKWYPTCFGTELWAAQVCQVEGGPSAITPKAHMTLTTDPYNGLFINILPNNEVSLVNTCVQDRAAFVECPPIYCGLRFLVNNPYRIHEVDTSIEDMLNDLERAYSQRENELTRSETDLDIGRINTGGELLTVLNKSDHSHHSELEDDFNETSKKRRGTRSGGLNEERAHLDEVLENFEKTFTRRDTSIDDRFSANLKESRVVGGKPSQPASWPWLVSIYKNGLFHCGGVLINELWVVTASHCVDRYWQYYYEIQAGVLRRFSYSPMDQRRWAKIAIPHEFYSKSILRNDIALMKLSAPVRYNKYVRPICLPSQSTAGQDFLKGPSPGTICTTVGWGATVEHGADPDHMREVEVPILQHCKHKEDSDVEEICAGLTDGGKDACQGDSGGPLMCRNPNNHNQWYLAGVVSHGEGCARPNEPGVYTKVSRYMGWIAENTREEKFTITAPLQKCPGYVCKGTKRCVPKKRRCDRIIDCLLGDDEVNCENHFKQIFKHSRKSNFATDILQNLEQFEEFGIVGSKSNITTEGHEEQPSIVNDETDEKSDSSNDEKSDKKAQEPTKIEEVHFKCSMMLQVISIDKRCNKIIDCEDGTDELNCTCGDYIKNVDPTAICDGVSDCSDLSDEKNCIICNKTEYTCRMTQKCIEISKRCDGTADCPQNEDEMNCASLTNGHTVTIDRDNRPMFKSRGIVTINHLGQWMPLCLNASSPFVNDEPSIATIICNSLGFHDYFSYHKYLVENKIINVTYSLKSGKILLEQESKKCVNCCDGLYVSCSNTSTSTTLQYKSLEQAKELYFSPWIATIYSNGHYKCIGTLIDKYWVVTSVNCFTGITILQGKYLAAVFGRGKINIPVKGPHEQIIRIVESIPVNETDIILLRLEQDVKYNRYVQAVSLNPRKDGIQKEKCYAVGRDNEKRVNFIALSPLKNCLVGFRCFEKRIEDNCKDNYPWRGTIICDSRNGWYPAAVFNEESGHCGFHHEKKYTSVKFYKKEIAKIIAQKADPVPPPECNGLQCNLGNCILTEKICDGVVDCHSGEDEKSSLCYEKEKECYTADSCVCPQTHLKCPSIHKCFPKSSFCDRVNNCGEFEDEPAVCSCRNYLKLTNPAKICDGVLHCMDRSDEDPNFCGCRLEDFQCGKSNKCVPYDMVCDGVKDCLNGEDEATCLSLKTENHDRTNAGEVMTRTAGVWHAGCFDLNYSTLQLEEICYKLGFSGSSANQLTPPHNLTTLTALRPVLDTFNFVWLRRQPGNKLRLRIRTGYDPYVAFAPDKRCHRLFIACI